MRLAELPGRRVFRLREHVPQTILAATATDTQRLGWIDDFTVITSVHEYVETAIRQGDVHTLLLDNFPGTGTQVSLFLSVLRQLAPSCTVSAVELIREWSPSWRAAANPGRECRLGVWQGCPG
jgi:adenylate kinase family enzyme